MLIYGKAQPLAHRIQRQGPQALRVVAAAAFEAPRDVCVNWLSAAAAPSGFFRNDHVGVEQWSWQCDGGTVVCDPTLTRELGAFAATRDRNLAAQGFPGASGSNPLRPAG